MSERHVETTYCPDYQAYYTTVTIGNYQYGKLHESLDEVDQVVNEGIERYERYTKTRD